MRLATCSMWMALAIMTGCSSNSKLEDRLTTIETSQLEEMRRDEKTDQDVQEIKQRLSEITSTLQRLDAGLQQIGQQLRRSESAMEKLGHAMRNRADAKHAAPTSPTGAEADEDAQAGALAGKILQQYGEALGLSEEQHIALADAMKKTFVSLFPVVMQARQGQISKEDVESAALEAIDAMVDALETQGVLSDMQLEQIRSGLPEVLRSMGKHM